MADRLEDLDSEDRLRLLRFVCSFAWADLKVVQEERSFVADLVRKLALDEDEKEQVIDWLVRPPFAEEVDPIEIPLGHRQLFLDAARSVVLADHYLHPKEEELLAIFEQLLR
ncbi:MAG: TerB family tellurite resistance protein [Deltaproteobacteria bacterium]|nr:TerB family tellurite resistance protein [Deltaproteobacteria bacterium]MBW2255264.1 TerB family tellurite resistance protein [Deltaproteobacteria bacterium]